jgi:hypothetical protein
MKRKYILHPGSIVSMNDGQTHYITAIKLAGLYGVRMDECYVDSSFALRDVDVSKLIHLWPSYTGNYSLPTA